MIVVTGMHRSGTSCVTGLLERCGLSLGTSHPLLNDPRFDNPKGHFENRTVVMINETILRNAGGMWFRPPEPEKILDAGATLAPTIAGFGERFNGHVIKDPRLCITMPVWQRSCPALSAVIFCLRNPLGVARSLARRDGIPIQAGLALWYEYNTRFVMNAPRLPLVIIDYDDLTASLPAKLTEVLNRLGLALGEKDVRDRIDGFYSPALNHNAAGGEWPESVPQPVRALYEALHTRACRPASSQTMASRGHRDRGVSVETTDAHVERVA